MLKLSIVTDMKVRKTARILLDRPLDYLHSKSSEKGRLELKSLLLAQVTISFLTVFALFSVFSPIAYADEAASASATLTFNLNEAGGGAGGVCAPLCPPVIPLIKAEKSDELIVDLNENGSADPGDTILYKTLINKIEPSEPRDLVYLEPLSLHLEFVEGSLNTTYGGVPLTREKGKEIVYVDFSPGEDENLEFPLEISFIAKVKSNVPNDIKGIRSQGIVYSGNSPTVTTDDPGTMRLDDPTVTSIGNGGNPLGNTGSKGIKVEKDVIEVINRPGLRPALERASENSNADEKSIIKNRIVGGGSLAHFEVTVSNTGEKNIEDFELVDLIDLHTNIQTGSLRLNGQPLEADNFVKETDIISIDITELLAGETLKLNYWVEVKEEINLNLGHLGTNAYVTGEGTETVFSDDPDTEISGDRTSLLFRSHCNQENYLSRWKLWLERLANSEPLLTPVILLPGTGVASGEQGPVTAGAAGSNEDDATEENERNVDEPKEELTWVLIGGQKKINNYYRKFLAGGGGEVSSEGGEEAIEDDTRYRYWPRYGFFGAGKVEFKPGTKEMFIGLKLDEAGTAGGAGEIGRSGLAYLQDYPNLPIYRRLTGSSLQRLGLLESDTADVCGEEYIPFLLSLALSEGGSEVRLNFDDLFRLVKSDSD